MRTIGIALAVVTGASACAGSGVGSSGNVTLGQADTETEGTGGSGSATDATSGNTSDSGTSVADTTGAGTGNDAMPTPLDLRVDASGNGILEPGETVQLEPAWEHTEAFPATIDATLQDLAGPAGGMYQVVDGTARYALPPAGSAFCSDGANDCYLVRVDATTRPQTHWDATASEQLATGDSHDWIVHIGASFVDVQTSSAFYPSIEILLHNGFVAGCSQTEFCPTVDMPREQAAIFIARVMAGGIGQIPDAGTVAGLGNYDCTGGTSLFADVPAASVACPAVHYLAANDITSGCGANPPTFCPDDPTLRYQFAVFLAAALAGGIGSVPDAYDDPNTGLGFDCDPNNPDLHFTDVSASESWCRFVHYIWARGATNGCGATTFCPDDATTREQAAALLVNGFDLELY